MTGHDPIALRQKQQEQMQAFLLTIPSVTFVGFETPLDWIYVSLGYDSEFGSKVAQTGVAELTREQRLAWVTDILRYYDVQGERLLRFGMYFPFARVVLKDSYEWVAPMWFQKASLIQVVAKDHNSVLVVETTERCMENFCYVAYVHYKP